MSKKWTNEEIQFLKFAYPNKDFTIKEISTGLNKTERQVREMASKLDIERYKEVLPVGYQRCRRCKELLPLNHFYKSKRHKSGIDTMCITCDKERKRTQVKQAQVKQYKRCKKCNEIKNVEHFNKKMQNKDGLDSYCNECSKKVKKESKIKKIKERGW